MVFWRQTFDVFDDKVNRRAFDVRELIPHARQDDVFHLGFVDPLFPAYGRDWTQ